MGVAVSSDNNDRRRSMIQSKKIDDELQKEKIRNVGVIKLLLLGPAECGKSTFLKQMKILHTAGFSDNEIQMQKSIIHTNIVSAMTKIINAMRQFCISFDKPDKELAASIVIEADCYCKKLPTNSTYVLDSMDLTNALKELWLDKGVQECFARGNEYHLDDSTKYFFNNMDRIIEHDYLPNEQDMLRSRVSTTGIVEINFQVKKFKIRLFDVGGQRSERRKWIHCFDDVNAVIFIVSLSEYNMVLMEDGKTNRMLESLTLFATICNFKFFKNSSIILFMNKTDIFAEKIALYPVTVAFPNYKGKQDYDECKNYITTQFLRTKLDQEKMTYVHFTCATDTKCIQFVSDACFDMIFHTNVAQMGLH